MRTTLWMATLMAVAATMGACSKKTETPREAPAKVKTETVSRSFSTGDRTYVGQVEEQKSTAVSFNGSGTITRMLVSEGDRVSKGQLIAELDPTQSRNAIRAAEAQLKQANDAVQRLKVLHDNQALPDMKWVEANSKAEEARAQLDLAKKAEADCRAYAPVSGIIGKGAKQTGETTLPALTVATILDINNVKIRVSIPEKEIGGITATTPTLISVEALHQSYNGGRIERDVQADELTHTYDIKILLPNPGQKLLPGMVCNVLVKGHNTDASTPDNALTVPITAVQQNATGRKFVWVIRRGKAHRQYISIGDTYGNRIAVSEGLADGQTIITEGYHKLSEGTPVKAIDGRI